MPRSESSPGNGAGADGLITAAADAARVERVPAIPPGRTNATSAAQANRPAATAA